MLINHHTARGDVRFAWTCLGVSLLSLVAYSAMNDQASDLLWVTFGAGAFALVAHEVVHGRSDEGLVRSVRTLALGLASGG
jgi:hypothetical protein